MTARVVSRNEKDTTVLALAINELASGRSNAHGTVTLTASAASTTVTTLNCSSASCVMLMPQTSNAAAAVATTYIVPDAGSFVIHHANNAQTDRTFSYAIQG